MTNDFTIELEAEQVDKIVVNRLEQDIKVLTKDLKELRTRECTLDKTAEELEKKELRYCMQYCLDNWYGEGE